MQVVVDSLLTTYHSIGDADAKVVVLLHGWGDNSAGLLDFGRQLAEDYRVILLDLPGFGRTDMPAETWGLDDYATFVAHFLDKIGVQAFAFLGHSNGGAIAIRGLGNGSLAADRLVLLASAGVRTSYKGRKKALRVVVKTGKAVVSPLPEGLKGRLRRKLYTTIGSDMLVAEHLQETFKRVVGDDVQADAARLSLPTLLMYGEQDVATPPEYGRLLHERIDGSTLQIIGEAEHFVHLDQPVKVLRLVREFLA